ncbi:MAG TPA: hypothetical protein VN213_03435 [Solirubrobacteraceae bacterium]|nr:hypothetical protein [Solirubrobacteraceae bacterium]
MMSPVLKTARRCAGILAGTVDVALALVWRAADAPVALLFVAGKPTAGPIDGGSVDPRLRR